MRWICRPARQGHLLPRPRAQRRLHQRLHLDPPALPRGGGPDQTGRGPAAVARFSDGPSGRRHRRRKPRSRGSGRRAPRASSPPTGVDVRQMELHRLDTDEQLRRHLTITHPHRHQPRHRHLLRGQPRRIEHTPLRRRQPTRRQLRSHRSTIRPRPQPHQPLPRRRQPLRRQPPLPRPPQHLTTNTNSTNARLKGINRSTGPDARTNAASAASKTAPAPPPTDPAPAPTAPPSTRRPRTPANSSHGPGTPPPPPNRPALTNASAYKSCHGQNPGSSTPARPDNSTTGPNARNTPS